MKNKILVFDDIIDLDHQDKIKRVLEIRDKLFPKGIPQERISNFSEFYVNEGINMISLIKNNLDPLSHKFSVIEI